MTKTEILLEEKIEKLFCDINLGKFISGYTDKYDSFKKMKFNSINENDIKLTIRKLLTSNKVICGFNPITGYGKFEFCIYYKQNKKK